MRKHILVRLHAAGATHSELRLFSSAPELSGDSPGFSSVGTLKSALARSGIREDRLSLLSSCYFEPQAVSAFERAESAGARIVFESDAEYPARFLDMPRRPFLLYVRWTVPKPVLSISVVGSRKASPYGREVTKRFVSAFVRSGVAIVSWGAAGIDSEAHSAAIASKGTTVAFVGTGIDVDYPRANRGLFASVVESGGAVVSPFAPGAGPMAYHFPIRNALVACFSDGTLVTEAGEKSGSLITAKLALEFWKEVFAVPWDVARPGSVWANSLIRDGSAKCVSVPDDVLCEFAGRTAVSSSSVSDTHSQSAGHSATRSASPLRSVLARNGTSDAETLSLETGIPIGAVLSELSELEIAWEAYADLFGNYSLK